MTTVSTRPKGATHRATTAPPSAERSAYRGDLQGLRAVAVLVVALYHAGVPGLSGGYVGVDVFFVLSGFLITSHLAREWQTSGRISLTRFYARRARRLLPAATLVAAVTVLLSWRFLSYVGARSVATDGLYSAFFGMNFRLARAGVDYQANTDPSPFQHYWSLAVEEQFYLVWPLMVIVVCFLAQRLIGRTATWASLVVAIATATGLSFALCVQRTAGDQPWAYFMAPARAWEFGVGALVALVGTRVRLGRVVASVLAALGVAGIVGSSVVYDSGTTFPGYGAAVPVLGAAAVVLAGTRRQTAAGRVLSARPLQAIGSISYGFYLWHWPLLVLAPQVLHHDTPLPVRIGVLALALYLAAATNVALEAPVRFLPRFRGRLITLALSVGLVGVVVVSSEVGDALAPPTVGDGAAQGQLQLAGLTVDSAQRVLKSKIDAGLQQQQVPMNLQPNAITLSDDQPRVAWADGHTCMASLTSVAVHGSCLDSATAGPTRVVVAGDSHAFQWMPAVEAIAIQRHWQLYDITKSGCPLYRTTMYSTNFNRDYVECDQWRVTALKKIRSLKPAMVITSGFVGTPRGTTYADNWNRGAASTITELQHEGARVVVLGDTPWPKKDTSDCLLKHLSDVHHCDFPRNQVHRDIARMAGTQHAAQTLGATYIDPTPWFCTSDSCPVVIGNSPVYRDDTHISTTYARLLVPVLSARLPNP